MLSYLAQQNMKDFFSLILLLAISIISNAQEGFWSIDQLALLQPKLAVVGLPFSAQNIRPAEHRGLAEAVIHLPEGNAVFVNDQNLALGVLPTYLIPDSIWSLMKNGVWLAKPGEAIFLNGLPEVFLQSDSIPKPDRPSFESHFSLNEYSRSVDATGQKWYKQVYQLLSNAEIIGVVRFPPTGEIETLVAVLLRFEDNPLQNKDLLSYLTFIPREQAEPSDEPHLVLGYPQSSSIHRPSFELQYALSLSKCHQDLDRALGAYLTRPPFITEDGVFRRYEAISPLEQSLPKRALWDAEFRHQLSSNPQLKTRYGPVLDSCRKAFLELQRYAPAQVYTKGIIYSPCSFFEAVRLFTMWRGRMGTSTHRLPTYQESQYFPEVFKRLPATENELLLPELLQRYFTQLPAEHLSPYAIRQAIYAQKDYAKLSETLLIQSKFGQPEAIAGLLNQDFLENIDHIATDPAVQLVDSMLHFYAEKVVPKMEKARQIAFQKANELARAMSEILPNYPAYPEADHSLRLSYGTHLRASSVDSAYWLSNAHLVESHAGSPVVNKQGKLIGIVKGPIPGSSSNAYYYDPEKSQVFIWSINSIRSLIATHPLGSIVLNEWQ